MGTNTNTRSTAEYYALSVEIVHDAATVLLDEHREARFDDTELLYATARFREWWMLMEDDGGRVDPDSSVRVVAEAILCISRRKLARAGYVTRD